MRPGGLPPWTYAAGGSLLALASGAMPVGVAFSGAASALDVDEFLLGMMLLAEIARREGLFDWLASHAVRASRGSRFTLFGLVYAAGTLVTIVMSNDATAVVLTPAVATALRAALAKPDAASARPHLFACAFIANAASFVLPISNPANLVVFGASLPPLGAWLRAFALPSLVAVAVTFVALALLERRALRGDDLRRDVAVPPLAPGASIAAAGIALAALALTIASARGAALGPPSAIAGCVALAGVTLRDRAAFAHAVRGVSYGTLALVAFLFALVRAVDATALPALARHGADALAHLAAPAALGLAALVPALLSNVANNLPVGLFTGAAFVHVTCGQTTPCEALRSAAAIGIDLGPNLSVTGSLATILWLEAIEREKLAVSSWAFLRAGAVAMPLALAGAIGVLAKAS